MAIFDKIGEIAKIAANKTEEITKTIGEKAEAAMEIQKLTSLLQKNGQNGLGKIADLRLPARRI